MNDDDDDNGGGGTLVIDVSRGGPPAHPAHPPQQQGYAGQPREAPADNPMPTQMLPTTDGPYGDPSADVERFFAHQRAIQGIGPAQLDESSTQLRKGAPASSQPMGAQPMGAQPLGAQPMGAQGGYTMPVPPTGLSGTQNLGGEAWRAQSALAPSNEPSYGHQGHDPLQSQPYASQSSPSGAPPPFASREPSVAPHAGIADARANAEHQRMLSEQSTIVTRKPGGGGGGKAILIGGLSALVIGLGVGATLYIMKRNEVTAGSASASASASASVAKDTASTAPTATTAVAVATSTPPAVPSPEPTPPPGTGSAPAPTTASVEPSVSTSVPTTPPLVTTPPVTPPAAAGDPETEAKEALKKLQTGLTNCVKTTSHVLPQTSPSVPGGLSVLKRGPYEPTARDWQPTFFTCTQFKIEQPMRFMIQWQLEQPNWRGSAIAWIDADGDGTAEKAYAFWAELKGADNVELGPIESVDPERRFRIPR